MIRSMLFDRVAAANGIQTPNLPLTIGILVGFAKIVKIILPISVRPSFAAKDIMCAIKDHLERVVTRKKGLFAS